MEDSPSPPSHSPSPLTNTNPNSIPNSKNTIHIGGIPLEFPYQPYGTQLAFMNRVISTLDRSQRDGHCHALLESPTGTGKSLSLLCSTLAWQQNLKLKNIRANLTHSSSRPNPEAITDPINHGGGFIPETQPSANATAPPPATTSAKKEKSRLAPTIFYSTRTHGQITQVIREYRKTTYRVPMAVLGSRKHYCTNPYLRGVENVDEQCKALLKKKEDACPEFKNVHKVKAHTSLQKGGCHEVHDIEDLVKIGQVVKGCSYFAARSMAQDAEIVFCPYNYIVNPIICDAMEVDITRSIIIFDEAHNIEDIARDAGSIDLEEEGLHHLQDELEHLSLNDSMTYQPLYEMTQNILSWIGRRKNALIKREFQRYFRCWSGDKALKELQEADISLQSFSILKACATTAIKIASEAEPDLAALSGMAANTLEGLFSSLNYFFSDNGAHANDYEVSIQKFVKKDGGETTSFSLWCLNPAVVFKSIAECSQSVILTSGTLSPLNSFSSELGVQFGTSLEAPHVIDVNSQVWAAAISNGPGNYPLNASYKTADEYAFQDAVGTSLEEICKVVPGGCLVFFPSYKLLDKVCARWEETGQWSRLNARKSFFIEPRGSQDNLEPVLKGYYNSIRRCTRQVNGRKIRSRKLAPKNGSMLETTKDTKKEGAAFLAVCRGKVSEGLDFSDDNARAVVVVGIPFPNIYDIKVAQKKKFNDTYELSKNLLNGNEWYCQQAFRALNQATGRCLRHRFDYGAVIFLDERFHKERNRAYISKWLRNSIRLYSFFEESMDDLKSFFKDVKDHFCMAANPSENLDIDAGNTKPVKKKNEPRKKNEKVMKSGHYQQKLESNDVLSDEKTSLFTQPSALNGKYESSPTQKKIEVVMLTDENEARVCREYINLECVSEKDTRWSSAPSAALTSDDLELTIVKETPGMTSKSPISTPKTISEDDYLTPGAIHHFSKLRHQTSCQPTSMLSFPVGTGEITCPTLTTPKRGLACKLINVEPETESSRSVNSHDWKRRKFKGLSSVSPFSSPVAQSPDGFSSLTSSITISDANRRTKELSHSGKAHEKLSHLVSQGNFAASFVASDLNMDQRLQVFCRHCDNPLGFPDQDFSFMCSLTSSSKVHLISLWKDSSESVALSRPNLDILVSDTLSVNQQLCVTAQECASGQEIWCKQDGCVFSSVFCPFCPEPNYCLGVQVLATDASNIKYQNKMLFFLDRLEIKNIEAKENEDASPNGLLSRAKSMNVCNIEKFAYTSPSQDAGGWRNTRSRMRLPKKG